MERTCEPELMDGQEQVLAYAAADFAAGDQAMVDRLLERFGPDLGDRLLDLGCGPGNITFRLARACPGATVVGLDGAARMLHIAEERRASDPAGAAIRFEQMLLPCPQWPEAPFSTVVSNSLLHHLHDPAVLWSSVKQLGAAGAVVQVLDLQRPADAATAAALVQERMAGAPEVLRRDFHHSLHAAFTPAEVERQLAAAGLEQLTVAVVDPLHLEVWGRLA
jgi:trans-aconitate 2-methyltransferase